MPKMEGEQGLNRQEKDIKLKNYLEYKKAVQAALDQIDYLHNRASGVCSLIPSDMPHGSKNLDKMEQACIDAANEEKRLKAIIARMKKAQLVTIQRINSLQDKQSVSILTEIYINDLSNAQIAKIHNVTVRTVENWHNAALDMIQM